MRVLRRDWVDVGKAGTETDDVVYRKEFLRMIGYKG